MLQVKNLVFDDNGRLVSMSGTYTKTVFSITTDKVIFWADYGLDWMGG